MENCIGCFTYFIYHGFNETILWKKIDIFQVRVPDVDKFDNEMKEFKFVEKFDCKTKMNNTKTTKQ